MTDAQLPRVANVCALLNDAGAKYVVMGATAMTLWGSGRATRDVDILIEPTVENATRVLHALGQLPFKVADDLLPEQLLGQTVTMIGDTPNVDVLTRAWNVTWQMVERDLVVFEVGGVAVPTTSLDLLIESKKTNRPQDEADVLVLYEIQRGLGPPVG